MPASPPPAKSKNRLLLMALVGAAVAFLATLPWQRQQWDNAQRMQEETAIQEARLRDVKRNQAQTRLAESRVKSSPADINAKLEAARAALTHGDAAGAGRQTQEVEEFVLKTPSLAADAALAATMAGIYQEAGWIDRALANAHRAAERAPNDVEALLRLAVIEAQLGWESECRKHIAAARRLAPDAAEPHLALALLDDQVGAAREAEREIRAADAARPGDTAIQLVLFRNLMGQRRYDDALTVAEKTLTKEPTNAMLLAARAEALTERTVSAPQGASEAARQTSLEAVSRYLQLVPDDPNAHYLLGKLLLAARDEAGAAREWEAALLAYPGQPKVALVLGRLLVRRGEKARGGRLLDEGERLRADATEYNRLLITAGMNRSDPQKRREFAHWCQKQGRFSRALVEWDAVLQLHPGDAEAARERAVCEVSR